MGIAASHAGELLSKDFGSVNYTPPASWFVGLLSGGVELSGGSYARVEVVNDGTNFPTVTTNLIVNGTAITFPQATADWAQADEVGLWIASSGGSPKYTDDLDNPVTVRTGQTRSFAASDLKIKIIPVI
jgi:hypothetical protein